MRREFVLNIVFLVLVNLIIKPFYTFFIETDIQNLIGPKEFGVYFSLFNLSYILQVVLDMGIHNYSNQYLAKNSANSQTFLSLALTTKAFLTLAFSILIFISALLLGYNKEMRFLLFLISFNQICISLIFFFRSSLAALGHYRSNSFISVIDKLIMILAFFYILHISTDMRLQFSLITFVGVRMVTYFITVCISWWLLYRLAQQSLRWHLDWDLMKDLLKKSLPFAIITIFMGLTNRTDAVMLERILDDGGLQSGIYAASYRIYYALNTLGFLFSMLLLPMFSSLLSNRKELQHLVEMSLKIILVLSIGAVALIYLLRSEIMIYLYKVDATLYGTQILMLLSFSFLCSSIIYVFGTLLTSNAKLKRLNYLFVLATVINITLNIVLIPQSGAYGAALASLITAIVVVIGQLYLSHTIVAIRLPLNHVLQIAIFSIIVAVGIFFQDQLNYAKSIKVLVSAPLILLLSILTRMLDYRDIYRLVFLKKPS